MPKSNYSIKEGQEILEKVLTSENASNELRKWLGMFLKIGKILDSKNWAIRIIIALVFVFLITQYFYKDYVGAADFLKK